jgi:pimeloyl-ACP methyl ester carboxylesterase
VPASGRAEAEVFAHYGIDAVSELLVLADPPMTTRVVRVGKGPPTVRFHGATLTSTIWAPLVPHLRTVRATWSIFQAAGSPTRSTTGESISPRTTAFVGGVLDALGLEKAALIGASMGGWFTLRFAIQRPERVVAAALVRRRPSHSRARSSRCRWRLTSNWLGR